MSVLSKVKTVLFFYIFSSLIFVYSSLHASIACTTLYQNRPLLDDTISMCAVAYHDCPEVLLDLENRGWDIQNLTGSNDYHYGVRAENGPALVYAFKGTNDLKTIRSDVNALHYDTEKLGVGGFVHKGFYDYYSEMIGHLDRYSPKASLKKAITEDRQLIFTGHSLGGAVANLCTFHNFRESQVLEDSMTSEHGTEFTNLKADGFFSLVTLGCPLLWSPSLARYMNQVLPDRSHLRFYFHNDPVTTCSIQSKDASSAISPFLHPGQGITLKSTGFLSHRCTTYMTAIHNKIPLFPVDFSDPIASGALFLENMFKANKSRHKKDLLVEEVYDFDRVSYGDYLPEMTLRYQTFARTPTISFFSQVWFKEGLYQPDLEFIGVITMLDQKYRLSDVDSKTFTYRIIKYLCKQYDVEHKFIERFLRESKIELEEQRDRKNQAAINGSCFVKVEQDELEDIRDDSDQKLCKNETLSDHDYRTRRQVHNLLVDYLRGPERLKVDPLDTDILGQVKRYQAEILKDKDLMNPPMAPSDFDLHDLIPDSYSIIFNSNPVEDEISAATQRMIHESLSSLDHFNFSFDQ